LHVLALISTGYLLNLLSKKMKQIDAEILEIKPAAKDIFRLTLKAPGIAEEAAPGQFVMIRPVSALDPLLPRPFSLHDWSENQGTVIILFRVVGKGTRILAKSRHGQKLQVVGPLGNGFDTTSAKNVCLVGGGIGTAPLLGLAKQLLKTDTEREIPVLLGGASGAELFCWAGHPVRNLRPWQNILIYPA